MSTVQMKVQHKCFKDGGESVESDPHSGRPATSRTPENVERVWAAVNKDQQLMVRELEAHLEGFQNYWLFPKLKSLLKGKRFQTVNEIQKNMMGQQLQ